MAFNTSFFRVRFLTDMSTGSNRASSTRARAPTLPTFVMGRLARTRGTRATTNWRD